MKKLLKKIKDKCAYEREKFVTRRNRNSVKYMKQPMVYSMDETAKAIKERRASIARFGDGEYDLMFKRSQGFQQADAKLGKRLAEVIKKNGESDKFLVGVPDCFGDLSQYTPEAQFHWQVRLDRERIKWVKALNLDYPYYNTQVTRFYFDFADKSNCQRWYENLKSIWDGERVLVIEGDKSRVGVGNDLFDNAKKVSRILCPAKSAFCKYDEIVEAAKRFAPDYDLVFLALGPTASVLAYDLYKCGFWVFDAGHIDIEYEWMRLGATEKVAIKNKYVNEVKGGDSVDDVDDPVYLSQIVYNTERNEK